MKRIVCVLFVAVSLIWVVSLRTDGFSPALIEAPLFPKRAPPLAPDAAKALAQPFHYLGKGRQCFVFESADQKSVLKFFNQKYLQLPWYSFLIRKEHAKRATRRYFYENSYEIAFRELGEEILYLHLNPSEEPLPTVSLIDKASRKHAVDLNRIPFVLQRKGIPFYEGLNAIYEKEGLQGLYREIDSFLSLIACRIAKNIADADHDVEHNWGYIEGKIFHLDPGRFYYDEQLQEPARLEKEWQAATRSFHKWLTGRYPPAADYLERSVKHCK